ncbi:MAG TPA: LysE family transporter [Actinomycetota bacterium]|nr:LysE family transporter [Actinomycetota bacterium]
MDLGIPLSAFGLGIALGTSPGPVQLLLFSEASRGGIGRGLRAMAGANATFGAMLLLLAAGLSSLEPGPGFLRVVKVVGGAFLVFLAVDALRENRRPQVPEGTRPGPHPATRGAVAVLLNPGVYVFLATTGTAVLASAADEGGRALALVTALSLLVGVSLMDSGMVLLGAGAHRVSDRVLRIVGDALAIALGALGVWLVAQGLAG